MSFTVLMGNSGELNAEVTFGTTIDYKPFSLDIDQATPEQQKICADFDPREIAARIRLAQETAAENVAMPLLLRGTPAAEAMQIARQWLDETGLAARAHHRAGELSGGEQQRVAFARALAGRPQLLLADEPTGDLDEGNAEAIFELMQRLHRSHRLTSILATHNLALARRCHRVFQLEHGILEPSGISGLREAQSQGEIG